MHAISQFVKANRIIFILVFAALAVRFLFLFVFWGENLVVQAEPDYLQTAQNFVHYGTWSSDPGFPPVPDSWRTPGYPLFLALFLLAGTSLLAVGIAQYFIAAAVTVFIYTLGKRVFSERVAFWAALFFAVEPYGAFWSNKIASENLFSLLFVPGLLLLLLYVKTLQPRQLYLAAILMGLSALVRPVAVYLFFALLPLIFGFIVWSWKAHRERLKHVAVGVLVFLAVFFPWLIRNRITLGTWEISSVGSHSLEMNVEFFYRDFLGKEFGDRHKQELSRARNLLPPSYIVRPDIPEGEPGRHLQFRTPETSQIITKLYRDVVFAHPVQYAQFLFLWSPRIFYDDSYGDFIKLLVPLKGEHDFKGVWYYLVNAEFIELFSRIKTNALVVGVGIAPKIAFFVLGMLALCSPVFFRRLRLRGERGMNRVIILSVMLLAMYAALSSPVALHRYRLPLNPLIVFLAFFVFSELRHMRKKNPSNLQS